MIKLKLLLERKMPKKFFHTTKEEYLPSIQQFGLRPTPNGKEWIYLTDEIWVARNYGNMFERGTSVILFEVDSRHLDESLLGPDDDDVRDILSQRHDNRRWYDLSWEESLKLCNQVTYIGTIPAKNLKVIEKWKITI